MDRNINILERQLHRLNSDEQPIDPVTDSDGLPQSFDDWCDAMKLFYKHQPCPSRVAQLIVDSVQNDTSVADVVSMMHGRFRQSDVRHRTFEDEEITAAVKDLALDIRTHKRLPVKVDIGQSRYLTEHFLAKYEDSAIVMPTNLIHTMQVAGLQLQARVWSVGSIIGLLRRAAAELT